MAFDVKSWLQNHHGEATLLGICPMSTEIVEAAIWEAAETGFVPMFIATPRQIDGDRGYTGWSQSDLVTLIEQQCDEYGYTGPYLLARDHGGPYQSFRDRGDASVTLDEAMSYAKETFFQDLEAGFDILHVDATEDPRVDGNLDLQEVASRTADLIAAIEAERQAQNISPVYYEVGTEEISGGMTEPDDFARYIQLLHEQLAGEAIDVTDRLLFIVGQVGTTMRINMTNEFDAEQAKTLVTRADRADLFLKVHYTDWLGSATLERFPDLGIGAANVGPEFAAVIVESLAELEKLETHLLRMDDQLKHRSEFMTTLKDVAVDRSPWQKFAPSTFDGDRLEMFAENNQTNIAYCVGRYVLNEPAVQQARQTLYTNVQSHSAVDPDRYVTEQVKTAIDRYIQSFNAGD